MISMDEFFREGFSLADKGMLLLQDSNGCAQGRHDGAINLALILHLMSDALVSIFGS